MDFITKSVVLKISEVFKERDVEEIIYGDDYDYEKEYYLKVNRNYFKIQFMDIAKVQIIIFNEYALLINNLKIYLISSKFIKQVNIESYYLDHLFLKDKLYIIFQTGILSLDNNSHINKMATDFINDFFVNQDTEGIMTLQLDECTIDIDLENI